MHYGESFPIKEGHLSLSRDKFKKSEKNLKKVLDTKKRICLYGRLIQIEKEVNLGWGG